MKISAVLKKLAALVLALALLPITALRRHSFSERMDMYRMMMWGMPK